jgi:hypothetical protein
VAVRRVEAVAALAVAVTLIVAGMVWLFGAYGLIGSGLVLAALTLFVFDVRPDTGEERRAEPVVHPARPVTRR